MKTSCVSGWSLPRSPSSILAQGCTTVSFIELGFSPDQSRHVNHWPDRVLAKDKAERYEEPPHGVGLS